MGHGKHCHCMVCSMGKAVGMIGDCTDKNCTDPSHKKDTEEKDEKSQNHDKNCDSC